MSVISTNVIGDGRYCQEHVIRVPAPTTAVPIVRNEAGTEMERNKRRHWKIPALLV